MKSTITKHLIGLLLSLVAGFGAFLYAQNIVDADAAKTIDTELVEAIPKVAAVIGTLVTALFAKHLGKYFPTGKSDSNDDTPGGAVSLLLLMGTVAAFGFCLPSCATTFHPDGSTSFSTDPNAAIGVVDRIVDYFRPEPVAVPAVVEPTGK